VSNMGRRVEDKWCELMAGDNPTIQVDIVEKQVNVS